MLELIGGRVFYFSFFFFLTFVGKSMLFVWVFFNNASLLKELEFLEGPKTNLD